MSGKKKCSAAYRTVRVTLAALGMVGLLSHAPQRSGQAVEVTSQSSADEKELDKNRFQGGASLKTEPDLESRLERARLFAEEGTYNHASTLWQNVLNQSGDTLITRDGRTYVSLAEDVERTIAKLPKAGLRIYRITADGEAQAILAGAGENEEQALAEIVRKYFVSSLGDDAAYKLGCIALDNYDFVGASQLFQKILQNHPDPSVSRADVWMRLAVATAHLGDIQSARESLDKAEEVIGEKPSAEVFELVRNDIERAGQGSVRASASSRDWPLAMGNPARSGQMRKLSEAVTGATLTKMWGYTFPLDFSSNSSQQIQTLSRGYGRSRQPIEISTSEKSLVAKWKSKQWRPAHQLRMADGRVYFKTGHDLTCWDMSGESEKPVWRTAWANRFQVDSMTRMMQMMMARMGNSGSQELLNRPASEVEVMLFGDRIHQAMSISRGMIFNIEGRQYAKQVNQRPTATNANVRWNYGVVPRRTRQNWLAAYDARTGKALWHRSAAASRDGDDADASGDVGFMAAPVPYGNLLLAPVSDGGTIWLYAMARNDGKTVWRSYLCDEPSGGCKPWSPVGVSVDGRDVYVLCGAGVIFAVDATTGTIRFAVRYERVASDNNAPYQRLGYTAPVLSFQKGWHDDIAIPYRNALVVMASDSDELFAIDRRTGEFLWKSPRTPLDHTADYAVGVTQDGGFIVAGKNCARRYDLTRDGLLEWQTEFESSYGRAMLTEDAVYVPVKNTVVRLDVKDGSVVNQATVSLTSDDPVGNLYSDGEKIWVAGANKIYALTNLQQRLTILERRISRGEANAHIERMKLLAKDNKLGPAMEDLLSAYEIVLKEKGIEPAAELLFEALRAIQLEEHQPVVLLNVMSDRFAKDGSPTSLGEELERQRADLIVSSLTNIRRKEIPSAAAEVLAVLPLLTQPYQLTTARRALVATATEEDVALLRGAVESGESIRQLTAVNAFVRLAKDQAKTPLEKLLKSDDEPIRLAAARGLANTGDREALSALVKLLDAKDAKVRAKSASALRHATGQQFGFTAYEDETKRAAAQKGWTEWVAKNGETAELNLPIPAHASMLGRTLIAYYSRNSLVELDENGKKRWEKNVSRPWACHGLPNGHRLVASYTGRAIIEYDADGKEVWKQSSLPSYPFSVRRLENGNTLVTCPNNNNVIEYKRDHSIAWQTKLSSRPADAQRLDNGNTLVALSGSSKVVEIGKDNRVVWEVSNMSNAVSVQRLDNGNTLIALTNSGAVEVDRNKDRVWTSPKFSQCYDAQRLPNGNTLLIGNNRVQEIDPSGTVVWQASESGARGLSRF